MRYYIEKFNGDEFAGYYRTYVTPEQVIELFDTHPVGNWELTPDIASELNINWHPDSFLVAVREYPGEAYEYEGEVLYPPPLFLPDSFNSVPAEPN